jgi:hypothetical protein
LIENRPQPVTYELACIHLIISENVLPRAARHPNSFPEYIYPLRLARKRKEPEGENGVTFALDCSRRYWYLASSRDLA